MGTSAATPATETTATTEETATKLPDATGESAEATPWSLHPAHPLQLPAELVILGRSVGSLVLHVQTAEPVDGSDTRATNGQSDAVWRAAFRSLRGLDHPAFPRPDERVLDETNDAPPRHGPIFWCERVHQVVRPLCATCWSPLRTLRDEGELQRHGLPSYRGTAYRFVTCHECLRAGRDVAFYTEDAPPLGVSASIHRGVRVHRDLATHLGPDASEVPEEARALHPCVTCQHSETCYPENARDGAPLPAETFLRTVSYHDALLIPATEPGPNARFHELAAYLGGNTPSPRDAFLYFGDLRGNFALECFHLKLRTFTELVEGLLHLHETQRRPHLGLSASSARGRIPQSSPERSGESRPGPEGTAWEARLAFGTIATAYPIGGFDPAVTPVPWLPLPGGDPSYVHRELRELAPHRGTGRLHFDRVALISTDGGDPIRLEVDATLTTRDLRSAALWNAALRLEGALGGNDVTVFARALDTEGDSTRLRGVLQPGDLHKPSNDDGSAEPATDAMLDDPEASGRDDGSPDEGMAQESAAGATHEAREAWERIANALRELSSPEAQTEESDGSLLVEFTAVSSPGAPSDIAALGVLWLQLLLCNEGHQESALTVDGLRQLKGRLYPEVDQSGPPRVRPKTEELIREFAQAGVTAHPENVIYHATDREDGAAIDAEAWGQALLMGVEMAAPTGPRIPAPSRRASGQTGGAARVGVSPFRYSPDEPAAELRALCQAFRSLTARTRSTLLGTSGDNRFVLEVCTDFRTDLQEAIEALQKTPAEPEPEEPDSAEVTIVMRRPPLDDETGATRP